MLQLEEPVLETLERYFTPERDFAQLFGRPDGFTWGTSTRFIEQNITSGPGGLAAIDALSHFFDEFPVVRALRERVSVERLAPLDAYVSFFSSPAFANKNIGYIDALDPKTGGLWDDDGSDTSTSSPVVIRTVTGAARSGAPVMMAGTSLRPDGAARGTD